jgi:DNA replication initiation complex subunit (GINS family)
MAEEGVNFGRITRIYREETSKNTLTKLEADFYDKLNEYYQDLKSRADKELSKDPHASKAVLLQDEFRKVKQKRDQIYRARERKIVLLASAKVGGTEVDTKVLTKDEKVLFDKLVENLRTAREGILSDVKSAPRKDKPKPKEEKKPEEPAPPKKEAEPEEPEESMAVIQVLEDIPPFAGIDVTYELKKEEVVTLPMKVARILSQSGKAKLLEISNP